MPIYEYRCNTCGKYASLFFRSISTPVNAACPSCKSADMQRLVSRVAILKSAQQQIDKLEDAERMLGDLGNPFDPTSIAHWSEQVGKNMGGELDKNFKEMAEQVTPERRPYELYDPIGAFQLALERKRRAILEEAGLPDPYAPKRDPNDPRIQDPNSPWSISDEIMDTAPYEPPDWAEEVP